MPHLGHLVLRQGEGDGQQVFAVLGARVHLDQCRQLPTTHTSLMRLTGRVRKVREQRIVVTRVLVSQMLTISPFTLDSDVALFSTRY